jgi:hypothetical protein
MLVGEPRDGGGARESGGTRGVQGRGRRIAIPAQRIDARGCVGRGVIAKVHG